MRTKKNIRSVIIFFVMLLSFSHPVKSQQLNDYFKLLTAGLKQSWRLDSVTFNSMYGLFKKETILLFKLSNRVIITDPVSKQKDSMVWLLEKKDGYALISLGDAGYYEIDFLKKKNIQYMRLRNQIYMEKNANVTEYYFVKSN